MLTKDHFLKVFPVPELPIDNDSELAADWLLNHGHKEPSQRVRTALKNVLNTNSFPALLHQYMEQMKTQIFSLDIENTFQLERARTYFLFPTQFLQLEDQELNMLERTLDSLLRLKIKRNMLGQDDFLRYIGLDTEDFTKLEYEKSITDRISSFAGVWNQSFLNQIDDNELSKKELAMLRISEIFDIVSDYPNSSYALQDLRQCIDLSQRVHLVTAFTQACNKKVLNAGVDTNNIILCYISTIKSFLIIEPRGVLLDNASRHIRRYLKEREDTVPSIVNALLNPNEGNNLSRLSDELQTVTGESFDELTLNWCPDPIDALPDFKKQDIIESLISIFDTKEAFINEFSAFFAKSLLSLKKYDISEVLMKLELLKVKFGQGEFTSLDVMVRDITESRLTNYRLHDRNNQLTKALQFSILSYMFWPELPTEQFKLPEDINRQVQLYKTEFGLTKKGRKMEWINAGVVDVQLELKDRTLDFEVTPDKASVIYAFDAEKSLTVEEVSQRLEMNEDLATRCLNFWAKNGVLKRIENNYVVLEEQEAAQLTHYEMGHHISSKETNALETYWPFISGMLSNLGKLSSARIHSFLLMSLPKEKAYNATFEELQSFLETCVNENRLLNENGQYKLA